MDPGKFVSEADFSRPAEEIMSSLLNDAKRNEMLGGGGNLYNILETNAAAIVLYYLRKALKFEKVRPGNLPMPSINNSFFSLAWLSREVALCLLGALKGRSASSGGVLFVVNVMRQYASIEPVIRKMLEQGVCKITVISRPSIPLSGRINRDEVTYLQWKDFRHHSFPAQFIRKMRILRREWKNFLTLSCEIKKNPILYFVLNTWFQNKRWQALRAVLLADTALETLKPSVIVTTDPTDFETKSFTSTGRARGIPSFCLEYGTVCKNDSEWRFFAQDYVGVFDQEAARILQELGVHNSRILVTGNPRLEGYRFDPVQREKFRNKWNVPAGMPLVAFMSFPPALNIVGAMESYIPAEEHQQLLRAIYGIVREEENLFLVVKPHPEEMTATHKKELKMLGEKATRAHFFREGNSYDVINAADVVITGHSTTGLETIYLGKPLITVNFSARPDYDDYSSSGAAFSVRTANALIPTIKSLLNDQAVIEKYQHGQKLYVERNPLFSSGRRSADYCSQVILSLAKTGKLETSPQP